MLKFAALASMVVGVSLAMGAFGIFLRKLRFSRRAVQVQGIVLRCEQESGMDGGWLYAPTVRFQRADGVFDEYTPKIMTNTQNYPVGTLVEVQYDPQAPGQVLLGKPNSAGFWFGAILLLLAGTVFFAAGALALVITLERREALLRGLL